MANVGQHNFQITNKKNLSLDCSLTVVFLRSNSELFEELLKESLNCNIPENICYAESGSDFPAACKFPFIEDGKEFYGCTDVNSPDMSK